MSVPKRRVVVSPGARADLTDILRYTARQWGKQQRIVYRAKLTTAMNDLRTHPHRGQGRDDLSPGLRAMSVEGHVVFYRVAEREITILRILHGNMDAEAHLSP